MIKILRRFSYW